ncbi:amino acid permease [Parvimonas sp. C2]|jgi:hypothetical protein|uniref:amino acid permease n=1 Tax=Parvimonas sp. C2 TaxID=3110692 RepID=UPI002B4758BC|nr:amino acid permease [Parvimonas sp. C2]MEB3073622.1 amino acid permease [Parvimonas sp. C2]
MEVSEKKIKWQSLVFMCFSTLWGFGNVLNGYIYFQGTQVIFSWVLMFALYFIPYALMVGELGSTFKDLGGGVTSWIQETTNSKLAYYAGWTYWAVHITYIAGKGSGGLKALSFMIFGNAKAYDDIPTIYVQLATFGVLLLFCYLATRGLSPIKRLSALAGSSMFVLGILFILMMYAAPVINPNGGYLKLNFAWNNIFPNINLKYLSNLSILVFAVGGIEKISPYVNKVEGDSAKEFPKAMMLATLMVVISAIFGTIAMGLMFDVNEIKANFDSYAANGAYWAFQKLGQYYGVGDLLLIIYSAANTVGQFATLLISIDAPLRMLLEDPNASQYIPRKLLKKNEKGAYVNGIILVAILGGAIILAQSFVPGATTVLRQLTRLNGVVMPMRYMWVFVAYFALRYGKEELTRHYRFVKNRSVGLFFGAWCFLITLACCLFGMYSDDPYEMLLKIITPLVLVVLGLVLPVIRKIEDSK